MKRSKITLIVVFCLSALVTFAAAKQSDQRFQASKSSDIFHSILRELNMLYVDTVDLEAAVNKGIDAMQGSNILLWNSELYSTKKEKAIELIWKYAIAYCLNNNAIIGNSNALEDGNNPWEKNSPLGVEFCERTGLVKAAKNCGYSK